MVKSWMITSFEFRAIRSFFNHLSEDVIREFEAIEQRAESGEIKRYEDLESAQDYPFMRYQIGMRAVMHELNSLIETEVYEAAYVPWKKSNKYKGPKSINDLGEFKLKSMSKIRMVNDINFVEAIELIEKYYVIKFNNVECWKDVQEIRSYVNAFKHRKGRKHFREIDWEKDGLHFPQQYELDKNKIISSITNSEVFLRSFDSKIKATRKN